jgi:hypothetical protein
MPPAQIPVFLLEAMISAGPRKWPELESRELGEDVSGFARIGGLWVFWLADGTGDSGKLPDLPSFEGFNARMLAQDLGQTFCAAGVDNARRSRSPAALDLKALVFDRLARDWQVRLGEYVARIRAEGNCDTFLASLPQLADGRYQIRWSSTLLGGIFDETTRTLDAVNFGDSGGLVVARPTGLIEPKRGNRVFVDAILTAVPETVAVEVVAHLPDDCSWTRFEGVEGFVAMTDGVIKQPLGKYLDNLRILAPQSSLNKIRRGLLNRADMTGDDKTIVFGRFVVEEAQKAEITLLRGRYQQTFTFDPVGQLWRESDNQTVPCIETGLPSPFARVFVKRLPAKAAAHDLLCSTRGQALPGMPCFYGYARAGEWHYYASESPRGFVTVRELLEDQGAIADLISDSFIFAAVEQACESFADLWSRGYVYTDFCAGNILRGDNDTIRLLAVDSCWPKSRLERESRPNGTEFDIRFWSLWNAHLAPAMPGRVERAPHSLALSFAAVWLRALALKKNGDAEDAVALVKDPRDSMQKPLWDALATGDRASFARYFRLADLKTDVYQIWQSLFKALECGDQPTWDEIKSAAYRLNETIFRAAIV